VTRGEPQEEKPARPVDNLEGPDQVEREIERDLELRHGWLRKKRPKDDVAHDDIPMSERFSR
jgi:hypothetical protein